MRTLWVSVAMLVAGAGMMRAQDYVYTTNCDNTITIAQFIGTNTVVAIPDTLGGLPVTCIGYGAFSRTHVLFHGFISEGGLISEGHLPPIHLPGTNLPIHIITNPPIHIIFPTGTVGFGSEALVDNNGKSGAIMANRVMATPDHERTRMHERERVPICEMISIGMPPPIILRRLHRSRLRSIIIPDSVTNIAPYAFADCDSLTNLVIGTNVVGIGDNAFTGCSGLTNVVIPESVAYFGDSPFHSCASLRTIAVDAQNAFFRSMDGVLFNKDATRIIQYPGGKSGSYAIPDSVVRIENDAFGGCAGLTDVVIPGSVLLIGRTAFEDCSSLSDVAIGEGVASIDFNAFYNCARLTNIFVSAANAFYSSQDGVLFDKPFTSLIRYPAAKAGRYAVPGSVLAVEDYAFFGSTNLPSVTIPNCVVSVGDQAFYGCSALTNVAIGSGVSSMGQYAFASCTRLVAFTVDANNPQYSSLDGVLFNRLRTTLIQCPEGKPGDYAIPDGVVGITNAAFFDCRNLTGLVIPDSVVCVGAHAFDGCDGLIEVMIGRGVRSMEDSAFAYCYDLETIRVDANNVFYRAENGVLFNKDRSTLIRYPRCKHGDYAVPGGVRNISPFAFFYCANLTNVTIASSVTNIGAESFYYCANLRGVYFLGNAPSLGYSVFANNVDATAFILPDTAGWPAPPACFGGLPTAWMPYAYTTRNGASTLSAYTGPGGSVTIPGTLGGLPVVGIGAAAFSNCSGLTDVVLPESVTTIGAAAFASCANLTNVTVGARVRVIGSSVFRDCPALKSVFFYGNAPKLGVNVFANDHETTVNYLTGTKGWGRRFGGRPAVAAQDSDFAYTARDGRLTITRYNGLGGTVSIPRSLFGLPVTEIGMRAFYNCDTLRYVYLLDGITSIGVGAFASCDNLRSVYVPAQVTRVHSMTFADCPRLTHVYFAGNAPGFAGAVFKDSPGVTVYYMPGTTGWSTISLWR